MSKPWEKYQQQTSGQGKPWEKYQAPGSSGVAAIGNTNGPTVAAEKKWYEASPKGLIDSTVAELPTIGAAAGSALGFASPIPGGTLLGAGAGGLTGQALKSLINRFKNDQAKQDYSDKFVVGTPEEKKDYLKNYKGPSESRGDFYKNLGLGAMHGVEGEMLGQASPKVLEGGGKWLYNNTINPMIQAGESYGKEDIAQELVKHGIANPYNLEERIQNILDPMTTEANAIIKKSAEAGGELPINTLDPAQEFINKLRTKNTPRTLKMADKFQKELDFYSGNIGSGPETLGYRTAEEKLSSNLHEANPGQPTTTLYNTVRPTSEPGVGEGVVGPKDEVLRLGVGQNPVAPENLQLISRPDTAQGDAWKQEAYDEAKNAYQQGAKKPLTLRFKQALGRSFKEGTENSVEDALGMEEAQKLRELNASRGKLLSTGKAQEKVEEDFNKQVGKTFNPFPSNTEALVGGVAKKGDINELLTSLSVIRALRLAKLAQMPAGYAMQKAAPIAAQNPWVGQIPFYLQNQGENNGQEK